MNTTQEMEWFTANLAELMDRRDLDEAQVTTVLGQLISGKVGEAEMAALLVAWRMKGETSVELAAAAQELRRHMTPLAIGREDVLDTCGTGGDQSGTFNISTAVGLVAAGAGVPVVKHGNRAVSSRSGSSEALLALGVHLREDPAWVVQCLERAGFAFCFAPYFHPALRHVAPVRRKLGVRTIFNCLGPLVNPAGAKHQLLGIGRPELLDRMAGALSRLGPRRAFLVCSTDGLDEVSLGATTHVREVTPGAVREHVWRPSDFGLQPCALGEIQVAGPAESAAIIQKVLMGQEGPAARVVMANAAAALLAADRVSTLGEGVALAKESISSGRAMAVLNQLIACSQAD